MPRFNHRDGRKRDYLRGYGAQFWYTGAHPGPTWAKQIPGFGAEFKKSVKRRFPALLSTASVRRSACRERTIASRWMARPSTSTACRRRRLLHDIGENERKMIAEMYDTAEAILKQAKAEILPFKRGSRRCKRPRNSRAWYLPDGLGSEAVGA